MDQKMFGVGAPPPFFLYEYVQLSSEVSEKYMNVSENVIKAKRFSSKISTCILITVNIYLVNVNNRSTGKRCLYMFKVINKDIGTTSLT